MLRSSLKPVARSWTSIRQASTSASTSTASSSRRTLYLGTVAATAGLISYTLGNTLSQRNLVHNDGIAPGTGNYDPNIKQYNEELKVNRHKIAAQQGGATPATIIHNNATSDKVHHIGSSKVTADGENVNKGDGTKAGAVPGLVKDKAEEAKQEESEGKVESAYNEETGEINWDCPCLGGMASGPCGEDFKAAFSCFVHSNEEPKGIECVEKFKAMQDCFRKHPDVYGEEIEPEEPVGQPTSTDGPGPLSGAVVKGTSLPEGHPDLDKVPPPPTKEPPKNSVQAKQTHENNPAKGIEKIQPRDQRADKKGKGPGDGTI